MVAFIDLLGFRELVSLSALHQDAAEHIYAFLVKIQKDQVESEFYADVETIGLDESQSGAFYWELSDKSQSIVRKHYQVEITQFSDSLVLSCERNDKSTSRLLMQYIAKLMVNAFHAGIFLRGGVTSGLLSHKSGGPLFGPALIEAYFLESQCAKWPRILISPKLFQLDLSFGSEGDPIDKLFDVCNDLSDCKQLTISSAHRYLSIGQRSKLDIEMVTQKLSSLAQAYSTDAKLGSRYGDLLNDWVKNVGLK